MRKLTPYPLSAKCDVSKKDIVLKYLYFVDLKRG